MFGSPLPQSIFAARAIDPVGVGTGWRVADPKAQKVGVDVDVDSVLLAPLITPLSASGNNRQWYRE
jgi:hypothetical protein